MTSLRLTLDEVSENRDGELIATLVADNGAVVTAPLAALPKGARQGDVLVVTIEPDPDETARRRDHIAELQRRLFG